MRQEESVNNIIGIGWDVGGWRGKKQGIAVLRWDGKGGKIERLGAAEVSLKSKYFTPQCLFKSAVDSLKYEDIQDAKIVIAIDAPLGYPAAYVRLVSGENVEFTPPLQEIDNVFAYRETERHIHKILHKKPLSAPFDKLGNNATVAIQHIREWQKLKLGFAVHPQELSTDDRRTIIEVYPAPTKKWKAGPVKLARELFPIITPEKEPDKWDAVICAYTAIAYAANGSYEGLPKLVHPPYELQAQAKTEGWIYYFEGTPSRTESETRITQDGL